jgi:uncharacterized protein YbjT (DUF2867 family)
LPLRKWTGALPRSAPVEARGEGEPVAPFAGEDARARVAVVGGTGVAGRHVVEAVRRSGHDAVVIARSVGVDVITGAGLDEALAGVDSVVDVLNLHAASADEARSRFGAATTRLLTAEQAAGVGHHVLLSILGVDRLDGNAHYSGKRRQEELSRTGPVPVTIVRAAQFHEFAGMVVDWTRRGGVAIVPPLLVQPIAASDVGVVLAEVATGDPRGDTVDLAGPEPQDLVDMARRTLAARGESIQLVPSWRGPFGVEAAGEVLLPGPDARLAETTFDTWLAEAGRW